MPEVKDPALLELLNGAGAAPAYPGVIVGRPKPVDPFKARDQQLQEEAAVRSQQQFDRTTEREERRDERTAIKDAMGGAEQGKAASFLERAINSEKSYRGLGVVQPRSLPSQTIKDTFPNVANYFSDTERQQADQSEREFIAAILRYDSGAAIPDNEYVTNGQIYFPRPGDAPETIEQKAKSRAVAIKSLLSASGPVGQRFIPELQTLGVDAAQRPRVKSGKTGLYYEFDVPEGADDAAILAAAKSVLMAKEPGEDRDPVFNPPRDSTAGSRKIINFEDLP